MRGISAVLKLSVLVVVAMAASAGTGAAQDRYWQKYDFDPVEDGFRSGWDYRVGFYYVSPGLLDGEGAIVRLSIDRAKGSNPTIDDIEIELQMLIDVPGTFGDAPIQHLLDIGFCDNAGNSCENYYWITNTLEAFTSKVGQKLGDWRDPGNSLSLSVICYPSFAAYDANERLEACPLERMKVISILGRVPVRDFLIRSRTDNLDNRRLALRFRAVGGEFHYAKYHVKNLLTLLNPNGN